MGIAIKCPMWGESKDIEILGKVNIDGLDPLMQAYICKHKTNKFGKGDKWLSIISTEICNAKFFIASYPNKRVGKLLIKT
jgi:hypothetical protein